MALVCGSEPSTTRFYSSSHRHTTVVEHKMVSSTSQNNKNVRQNTASAPSSSPPMPIPPRKEPKSSIPTPINSHEEDPKTPNVTYTPDGHLLGGHSPPTPGDALPEKAQRKPGPLYSVNEAEAILDNLKSRNTIREKLKVITGDVLLRLRASIPIERTLPFVVGKEEFIEWDHDLPADMGGYEYHPQTGRLIIMAMPGPIHERVSTVFTYWFKEVMDNFGQQERLHWTANEGQKLSTGRKLIPDGSISVEEGPPVVILEVGVSQPFESSSKSLGLKEKAEIWLLEGTARLVILVDIEIDVQGDVARQYDSFESSTGSFRASQADLPYGLKREDLQSPNLNTLGSKILEWSNQNKPLIKLQRGTIYLFRRTPGDDSRAIQNTKFVFFEEGKGFAELESYITTTDMAIVASGVSEKISLPLDSLKACFPSAIKKQSMLLAEDRAENLLKVYNLGPETASEFQPSSGPVDADSHTIRSGVTAEALDPPETRRKSKRKRTNAPSGPADLNSSFGLTDSFRSTDSCIFPMDSQGSAEELYISQRASPVPFPPTLDTHKASDRHAPAALDPLDSSTQAMARTSSKRKKGKASRKRKAE